MAESGRSWPRVGFVGGDEGPRYVTTSTRGIQLLYDDIVAEFRWSPEQMSAPFDLRAADEVIRKRIEGRRGSAQAAGRQQAARARQTAGVPSTTAKAPTGGKVTTDKA